MVSRDSSVVRSRWDARSIRRSWTKRIGDVAKVRCTERCSVLSVMPMAQAASGMLMGSVMRSRTQRSNELTVGSLCASALGIV
jgi:hypothetical protein